MEESLAVEHRSYAQAPEALAVEKLRAALRSLMDIEEVRVLTNEPKPAVQFAGRLVEDDQDVIFEEIVQRFAASPFVKDSDLRQPLALIGQCAQRRCSFQCGKQWLYQSRQPHRCWQK